MRVIAEIPHPGCKITVFSWNGKYIIKLEKGALEQTYKVPEWDLTQEGDVQQLLDETFVQGVLARFADMETDLRASLERL